MDSNEVTDAGYPPIKSGSPVINNAGRRRNHALLKCAKLKWLSRSSQVKSKRDERGSRKIFQRNVSMRFTNPHVQPDRQLEKVSHEQIFQDSSLNQLSGTGSMDYIPSACLGVWEYYPTPSISGSPAATHDTLEESASETLPKHR
ncbi:hypothetical protein PHET_01031 [Paragonimus heterotremus]|uniref:Uncharacterized protein n=1 Tax=Paragonimus heterotremus TaxID=100268 RepID=A0A8J4TRV5_9TREM|nr:hypothetical protein PHET_01031 [Paragonimus heterotremus]